MELTLNTQNTKGYFESNPKIVKIFEDLERFKNFCRFEFLPWNERNLYNNNSPEWRAFRNRNNVRKHRPYKNRKFK